MADSVARLSSALVDRYRIERELGQGGMATVHVAHDVAPDGQRFVMIQGGAASVTLIAVHNAFDRLVYDRRQQR